MNYSGYGEGRPGSGGMTPAIKWLSIICVVVFFLDLPFGGRLSSWFGFSLSGCLDGFGLGSLRVLSYMWLHQLGNPFHLLWNLLFLYWYGTMCEARLGYLGTWKMFVAGGVAGGLLYAVLSPLTDGAAVPVVGASGAVTAFIVYAATWRPHLQLSLIFFTMPLWVFAAIIVGLDVYMSWFNLIQGGSDGVARTAHVGGALLGYVACRRNWFIDHNPYSADNGLLSGVRAKVAARKAATDAKKEAVHREVMDRLLEKISKEGMGALTPSERRYLERTSKNMKDR